METKKFCAYNKTRESFLSAELAVIHAEQEPLKILKVLIEGLPKGTKSGLWLTHFRGVPVAQTLSPFDMVYVDKDYRVVHCVELTTDSEFEPFTGHPASALVLPPNSIYSSDTRPEDQLSLDAVQEAAQDPALASSAPAPAPVPAPAPLPQGPAEHPSSSRFYTSTAASSIAQVAEVPLEHFLGSRSSAMAAPAAHAAAPAAEPLLPPIEPPPGARPSLPTAGATAPKSSKSLLELSPGPRIVGAAVPAPAPPIAPALEEEPVDKRFSLSPAPIPISRPFPTERPGPARFPIPSLAPQHPRSLEALPDPGSNLRVPASPPANPVARAAPSSVELPPASNGPIAPSQADRGSPPAPALEQDPEFDADETDEKVSWMMRFLRGRSLDGDRLREPGMMDPEIERERARARNRKNLPWDIRFLCWLYPDFERATEPEPDPDRFDYSSETEFAVEPKLSWDMRFLCWLYPELDFRRREAIKPRDRRRAGRLPLPGLVAYFFTGGPPRPQRISDISVTGFYMHTQERWMPGTIIRMTLQKIGTRGEHPSDTITVHSKVVRWGGDGEGFEFVLSGFLDQIAPIYRRENVPSFERDHVPLPPRSDAHSKKRWDNF